MKEICTLSITRAENEALTELANFCYNRVACKGCPLREACDNCLKRTEIGFEPLSEFLTKILIKVKIEEED